jgi:hypothetical protein
MKKLFFVSFASGKYRKNIFWNKIFVKLFIRPSRIRYYTEYDLKKSDIYRKNKLIFDSKPGGCYAWKPWVILKMMDQCEYGDMVIYHDCGKGLKYKNIFKPIALINHAIKHDAMPGVIVTGHGKNKHWCHRACFKLMECDYDVIKNGPQIEASISIWVKTEKSLIFLQKWLNYATIIEVIQNTPNELKQLEDCHFKDHRYDQSILTNLIYKFDFMPFFPSFREKNITKSMSLIELDARAKPFLVSIVLKVLNFKYFFRVK